MLWWSQANAAAQNVGPMRLYVGNLSPMVSDGDLRAIFSPFGDLDTVQVQRNP